MKVKLVKRIVRKTNPYADKVVKDSHVAADKAEKKRYPKGFKAMNKIDAKLPKGEFAGENSSNTIEVSKKVPKKYRKEVVFHERKERQEINKRMKKK